MSAEMVALRQGRTQYGEVSRRIVRGTSP